MLRVLFVTAPPKAAAKLARALLKERLIACANLLPGVRSLYWWQGRLESGAETLLVMKAPARNVARLLKRVPELHPYDVPEIIALPVVAAHKPYAKWVETEATPRATSKPRKARKRR